MREPHSIHSQPMGASSDYFGEGQDESAERWLIARVLRAAAEGVLPTVILAAIVALFWEVSVIGRVMAAPYGIDMVQRTEMVTAGGGLVIALIVYLISSARTLQGVRAHQRAGSQIEAMVTLAFLVVSALITLMPLCMALTFPQHPAP